jgi:hypothetical protein
MYLLVKPRKDGAFKDTVTGTIYRSPTEVPGGARIYSQSVAQCVIHSAGWWSHVNANRHGHIISAFGKGIALRDFQSSYPGSDNVDDASAAEDALNSSGLTRGHSPAGRALDYAQRTYPKLRQWRAADALQRLALSAVYGGLQFGGPRKPDKKKSRITEDIISSYPFTASMLLPSVAHCRVERGMRKNAVLYHIGALQTDVALFTRTDDGSVSHAPEVFGWYTPDEIEYHVSTGRLRVQSVSMSLTCSRWDRYLAPVVEHLFTQRESYARSTPERAALKSALNGLIGKYAAPLSSWRMAKEREAEALQRSRAYPMVRVGNLALVDDPKLRGLFHRDTNGLWTALSYARARVRLWQKIDDVTQQGGEVLWCHTDSVVADVPRTYRATYGEGLGDWRRVENDDDS